MRITSIALASALLASLSGAALAQTGTAGSTEKNLNNPGSVKSNAEKGMPAEDRVTATGPTTGSTTGTSSGAAKPAPGVGSKPSTSSTGAR